MVINDALRVAGRPRGVVERDRIPLIGRAAPCVLRIALRNEGFVIDSAEAIAGAGVFRIIDVDQADRSPESGQRFVLIGEYSRSAISSFASA